MSQMVEKGVFNIPLLSNELDAEIQHKIDMKTKPQGSLGRLESLAAQIARLQHTLSPCTDTAMHLVFAADHGVCEEGVSPFPQEVTAQMVLNFLQGGAAINVFCRHNNVGLKVIDAGVKTSLPEHPDLVSCPVASGTRNFAQEAAMSAGELAQCLQTGAEMVDCWAADAQVLSLGEMGIGNTTTAAAVLAALLNIPARDIVGAGTGASPEMQVHKAQVIQAALERHQTHQLSPLEILQSVGGLEIAMMTGAFLRGAALKKLLVVDGFIATSAWMVAYQLSPHIRDYTVFAHQSHEQGHQPILSQLGIVPLLTLDMRLGEGTGAIAAIPLIRLATAFLNEMASFDDAGVSQSA
ncbi:Nicotinate-nucleotide--dimethylbenzimidazole phosphoribosyltransferase [Nitrincola nitratireducens]|uniref:Nicotinate-nucleotide--dimethylbenzimidazole phosphoribosyltransferase n=2 Tax=Nitrincola nitratireducens TaxID=1229521 RepID=W9VR86_9GAMM|nr:Nicotinate-nucleotide--dimethylbenzimidazole phosphoribosyltransferase [Nitrincola nitratireducens]